MLVLLHTITFGMIWMDGNTAMDTYPASRVQRTSCAVVNANVYSCVAPQSTSIDVSTLYGKAKLWHDYSLCCL